LLGLNDLSCPIRVITIDLYGPDVTTWCSRTYGVYSFFPKHIARHGHEHSLPHPEPEQSLDYVEELIGRGVLAERDALAHWQAVNEGRKGSIVAEKWVHLGLGRMKPFGRTTGG
jgi:hypothetical protein